MDLEEKSAAKEEIPMDAPETTIKEITPTQLQRHIMINIPTVFDLPRFKNIFNELLDPFPKAGQEYEGYDTPEITSAQILDYINKKHGEIIKSPELHQALKNLEKLAKKLDSSTEKIEINKIIIAQLISIFENEPTLAILEYEAYQACIDYNKEFKEIKKNARDRNFLVDNGPELINFIKTFISDHGQQIINLLRALKEEIDILQKNDAFMAMLVQKHPKCTCCMVTVSATIPLAIAGLLAWHNWK